MATPLGCGPVLVNVGWEAAAASEHRRHLVAEDLVNWREMPGVTQPEPPGLDEPLTPENVEGVDGFYVSFKDKGKVEGMDYKGKGKGKGRGGKGPKGPHPPEALLVRPTSGFSGVPVNAKTGFPVPNPLLDGAPTLQERRSRIAAVVQSGQVNPSRGGGPMLDPPDEWGSNFGSYAPPFPKKKSKPSQNDRRKKKIKEFKELAALQGIENPIVHIALKYKRKKSATERAAARTSRGEGREEPPPVSLADGHEILTSSRPPLARRRGGGSAPIIGVQVGLDSRPHREALPRSRSRSRSREAKAAASEGESLSEQSKMLREGQARDLSPRSASPLNEETGEEVDEETCRLATT
jgi:hypothetical protein